MKDLSKDVEYAISNCIDVLNYDVDIVGVKSEKLQSVMSSKIDTFASAKELILTWENSLNAPRETKLRKYVQDLVDAGENAIEVLRFALRKDIDPNEVDPERHGIAAKAKPLIFKAISEINSGVIQLRMQLDAGKIDLKAREFTRSFPEKFANQEFFPEKDYYKEWYDEATDSVMLCPLGTKGEIINLSGLNIMLPKPPPKTKILFHKLPKEEQYWRRTEVPKGLTVDTEDQFTEYILEEFRRRREGVWFYNNGVPVWLTPAHYMALQHIKMLDTGECMDFRFAQRDMFYFTRACDVDQRCLGEFFVKSRRTGFTYQIICEYINDGTMMGNSRLGMISKTGEDAQENFLKMAYGIQNLPFFFVPVVKGKIDSKTEIEFAKPSDSTKTSKKKKDNSTDDYLNTLLNWKTTTESAYDGLRMKKLFVDEASKPLPPFNLETYFGRVAPTVNNGGRIVGKLYFGSTVNPMSKGGDKFYKMYLGSIISKRDKDTNKTATGLYAHFLAAHLNMELFTDKYGVCHTMVLPGESFLNVYGDKISQGSIQYLENIRRQKRKQSPILYNEELRANPMTVEEAFRDEAKSSLFDLERLNDQIAYNNDMEVEQTLVRGNFSWKDNIKDSEVVWTPAAQGRFLLSWIPPKELQNRWTTKANPFGGQSRYPLNDDLGSLGVDSYDIDAVQDSQLTNTENGSEYDLGSKGAIHGVTGMTMKDAPSNYFFLEYIARPQSAEIFFEDALMATVFYGMPIMIESNKARILYHFKNRGYRGFVITRFDKPANRLSPTEKMLGGLPSNSEDVIHMHANAIELYINKYVGIYSQGQDVVAAREEGEIGSMPFNRTLRDFSKFDLRNRTKHDATISAGLALLGCNRKSYTVQQVSKSLDFKIRTF